MRTAVDQLAELIQAEMSDDQLDRIDPLAPLLLPASLSLVPQLYHELGGN